MEFLQGKDMLIKINLINTVNSSAALLKIQLSYWSTEIPANHRETVKKKTKKKEVDMDNRTKCSNLQFNGISKRLRFLKMRYKSI